MNVSLGRENQEGMDYYIVLESTIISGINVCVAVVMVITTCVLHTIYKNNIQMA
jgi:hypothetical protein